MLLGPNDEIWLSDFGIAVIAHGSQSQTTQGVAGSWIYTAPEQFKGKPLPASDQYALGIVVYEWLSGSPPFQGSFPELYHKHQSESPAPLHMTVPSISPAIEQIVLKTLAKDPQHRFSSILEFAQALEQAASLAQSSSQIVSANNSAASQTPVAQSPLPPTLPAVPFAPRGPLISTYRGHSVGSLAWSPDGKYIASHGNDIHVWEVVSGNTIFTYPSQQNQPQRKTTGFWNRLVSEMLQEQPKPVERPRGMNLIAWRWSPTNLYLATSDAVSEAQVWDILLKKKLATTTYSSQTTLHSFSWSPDEKRIFFNLVGNRKYYSSRAYPAYNSYGAANEVQSLDVVVWEILTGKSKQIYNDDQAITFYDNARTDNSPTIIWSPNGQQLAVASRSRGVYIWNISEKIVPFYHTSTVNTIAWSPNSRFLATGGTDQTIRIWETSTEDCIFIYRVNSSTVKILSWSPDGACLASVGTDSPIINVWNISAGKEICQYKEHTKPVNSLTWLSNRQHILSQAGEEMRIWDVWSGKTIFTSSGTPFAHNAGALLSPDMTHVAFIDNNRALQVWNANTGSRVLTYLEHGSFVWSPDSTRVASIPLDRIARVWQAV